MLFSRAGAWCNGHITEEKKTFTKSWLVSWRVFRTIEGPVRLTQKKVLESHESTLFIVVPAVLFLVQ